MKPTDVTTGIARLSFVHVFTPYAAQPGQEAKYSTTILVPKTDVNTKMAIDAAINAAITAGVLEQWGGIQPPVFGIPVYDGDGVRPYDGMPYGAECKGHWVFTAGNKTRPEIVDLNMQPIIDQSEIYSGVYARALVTFFAYNKNGKKGIGCSLNAIQKMKDGEPLGGRVSAAEGFGGQNAVAPQQAAPQAYPQQGYQPPAYQQAPQPTYQTPAYGQPAPQQAPAGVILNPLTGEPM